MAWGSWMILGLVLIVGELLTPGGFFLLFFGLGAMVVSGLVGLGLTEPAWLQWLIFALLSPVLLLALRTRLLAMTQPPAGRDDRSSVVGGVVTAVGGIAPGAIGQGDMRGTVWSLRNTGGTPIAPGDRCRVIRAEGLTLDVERQ